MGAPVVHFEVNTKDLARAKEFYGTLFKWNIQGIPSINYGMVDTGVKVGINGGLGQVEEGKTPFATFYVQVENPQAVLDKAVSLGATVVVPVTVIPDMVTYALFLDPDGCLVGLVQGSETLPEAKPKPRRRTLRRKTVKAAKSKPKKKRGRK